MYRAGRFHLCELWRDAAPVRHRLSRGKSYDTLWMVQLIKPYLKEDGVLVSLQNSINDEWIPSLSAFNGISAAFSSCPPRVLNRERSRGIPTRRRPGLPWANFMADDPRLKEIAEILGNAGRVDYDHQYLGGQDEQVGGTTAMISGVCGIFGLRDWELIQRPELVEISIRLGRRACGLGRISGTTWSPSSGMSAQGPAGIGPTMS